MSYTNLNYHIVFSTKDRRALLNAETMSRLVPYLGGILRDGGGTMLRANGPADHIHVVATLPPTTALSDVLRIVKAASSRWIHQRLSGGLRPRLNPGHPCGVQRRCEEELPCARVAAGRKRASATRHASASPTAEKTAFPTRLTVRRTTGRSTY